jgi:hypothetical protein
MARAKGTGRSKAKTSTEDQPTPDQVPSSAGPRTSESAVTDEERNRMIAEAAYFRAQARGFAGGDPVDDWLAAEAEINRKWPTTKQ